MRGRVQIHLLCANGARAVVLRDWLTAQLAGHGYIADPAPRADVSFAGDWVVHTNVALDTVAEGQNLRDAIIGKLGGDPLVLPGSSMSFHRCRHEDGVNDCAETVTRTVK